MVVVAFRVRTVSLITVIMTAIIRIGIRGGGGRSAGRVRLSAILFNCNEGNVRRNRLEEQGYSPEAGGNTCRRNRRPSVCTGNRWQGNEYGTCRISARKLLGPSVFARSWGTYLERVGPARGISEARNNETGDRRDSEGKNRERDKAEHD